MGKNWRDFKVDNGGLAGAREVFENACETLFKKQYPQKYVSQMEVNPGDGGIDIFIGKYSIEPIIVVQCKFFLEDFGSNQKQQIKHSFNKAYNNKDYKLSKWILCIPRVFTQKDNEWWFDWVEKQEMDIDLINGNELISSMKEHSVYNQIFQMEDSLKIDDIHTFLKHSSMDFKSRNLLKKINEMSPLFVYTDSYYQALELLKGEDRCCIISGNPGVGKTTLAYMLLLYFTKNEKNLEIIKIRSVKEAYEKFKEDDTKQIFYFDDFLGQNFRIQQLEKNEDSDILDLINNISEDENKYIIFTTREYILNQAKTEYPQLSEVEFSLNKIIIDINNYSYKVKDEILRNHLKYYSIDIDKNFISNIINHKNYNPQIIKRLTDKKLLNTVNMKNYGSYFLENLNFPEKIWLDIIDNDKISLEAKTLLYVLLVIKNLYVTNETDKLILEELKKIFNKQYEYHIKEYNKEKKEKAFDKALEELTNSFICIEKYTDEDIIDKNIIYRYSLIEFYDSSIDDFLFGYLKNNEEILGNLIDGLELFKSFNYSLGNFFNLENNNDDIRMPLTKELQKVLIQSVKNRDNLELDEIGFIDKIIINYKMHIDNDMNNKMKESLEKLKLNEKEDYSSVVIKYKYTIKEIYIYYELSIKYKINKYSNQELYDIVSHDDKMGYYAKKGYTTADLFSFSKICNFKEIIRDKDNEQAYIDAFFSDGFIEIIEPIFEDTDGSDNKRNNISIWANDLFSWLNSYSNQFIINSKHIDNIKDFFRYLLDEIDEEKNKDISKEDIIKMFDNIKMGLNDKK